MLPSHKALILVAFSTSAVAFELDPLCHDYHEMIQKPNLTYEDMGKIAEAMYNKQCWPAMQGLLPVAEVASQTQDINGLPSCEYLASQFTPDAEVHKVFEVRPMIPSDCGRLPKRCAYVPDRNDCQRDVWPSTLGMPLAECDLLVADPAQLEGTQHGLRPVNCRGKILYSDGTKAGFYFYMEQYSDGDRGVWGRDIFAWRW